MNTPEDLKNLSKDELLALLLAERKKSAEVKKYEKKYAKLERQNQKLEKKVQKLEHKLQVAQELIADHVTKIAQMSREAKHRIVIVDEVMAKQFGEQLLYIFEEMREWMAETINLRAELYKTGPDVRNTAASSASSEDTSANSEQTTESNANTTEKAPKSSASDDYAQSSSKSLAEQIDETKKKAKSLSSNINRKVTRLINQAKDVVQEVPESMIASCPQAVKEIYDTKAPEVTPTTPNPSKGRQKSKLNPTRSVHGNACTDNNTVCPECGTVMEGQDSGNNATFTKTLISNIGKLANYAEVLEHIAHMQYCPKCLKVHGVFNKDEDLPIKPNREIGIKLALDCADNIYMGQPINRLVAVINLEMQLGHSTLLNNIHDFVQIYLKPLGLYIFDIAKQAKYLQADGTPFSCLESQQRGVCHTQKKEKSSPPTTGNKDNNEIDSLDQGISNYILSICNVPLSDELFSCYSFLSTRSAKSIRKVLTDEFKFSTLICDAFGGYDTIAKEKGCTLQNCLVHLRRYLIEALNPEALADEIESLSNEERAEFFKSHLQKGSDRLLFLTVYTAITKIYAFEASIDLKAEDALNQLSLARKQESILFNHIEKIMEEMVKRHLVKAKKGNKLLRKKGDPYSKFTYYWAQRKNNFRTYLSDPMIPPDSNLVEQSIRPITILRKNSYFMTSKHGIDDLCTIYTIWATLKKRGIKNPADFLYAYCRDLFSYCFDKNYTQKLRNDPDPENLKKKIVTWDMQKLSEGFDFKKYFSQI